MTELAVVRNYAELLAALRMRSDALKLTRDGLDDLAGLASGHAGKLLAPVPLKTFGMRSLGPVLAVLGLKLVIVEDAEMLAELAKRITQKRVFKIDAGYEMLAKWRRKKRGFRGSEAGKLVREHWQLKVSPRRRRAVAKIAAEARWAPIRQARKISGMSPEFRVERARKAARARWSRVRANRAPDTSGPRARPCAESLAPRAQAAAPGGLKGRARGM